jgi:hypothetical protein
MREWIPTAGATGRFPEHGQRVDWMAPSGEQVDGGRFDRGMWFLPGGGMYVYYTPSFWRESKEN